MAYPKLFKATVYQLMLLLIAGCGGDSGSGGEALPADVIRLKRFDILDREGFQQPIAVITLLAPADWRLEGGVRWNLNTECTLEIAKTHARLLSPDGSVSFEVFPRYVSMWTQDNLINQVSAQKGCITTQPINSEQFIRNLFIPGFRPGAEIISIEPQPELAQAVLQKQQREHQAMLRQWNARIQIDISIARIQYTEAGNPVEEWVLCSLMQTEMLTFDSFGRRMPMYTTEAQSVLAFKTPRGEFEKNKKLLDTMLSSYRANPNYARALQNVQNKMHRIQMKGLQDRFKIQQEMHRELSSIQDQNMESWKRRMASDDLTHSKFIRSIHGTENYSDPQDSGVRWNLNAGYNNVWKTANDEFILTNDVNFNPNIGGSQDWMRMKKQD